MNVYLQLVIVAVVLSMAFALFLHIDQGGDHRGR